MFGNDVFVSLPTGYGKSHGLLPCVFDALRGVEKKSIVLVVCPLVALMKEHVQFSSMGIPAAYVSGKWNTEHASWGCCQSVYDPPSSNYNRKQDNSPYPQSPHVQFVTSLLDRRGASAMRMHAQ